MLLSLKLQRLKWSWMLAAVALLAAAIAASVVVKSHANKHSLADSVRNCPDDKIGLILFNKYTGRTVIVCEYEPDQWGRLITEQIDGVTEEVTAFAHSTRASANEIGYVTRNLVRQGYTKIEFVRDDLVEIIAVALGR